MDLCFHNFTYFMHITFLNFIQACNILNIHDVPNIWHIPLLLTVRMYVFMHMDICMQILHFFLCLWLSCSLEISLTVSWVCFCDRTRMLIIQFLNNSTWSGNFLRSLFCKADITPSDCVLREQINLSLFFLRVQFVNF